jgi:hypothetical protein
MTPDLQQRIDSVAVKNSNALSVIYGEQVKSVMVDLNAP